MYLIQRGTDGLGHQLHGLFTVLALHGVRNFKFDAEAYLLDASNFAIGHDNNHMTSYLIKGVELFLADHPHARSGYKEPDLVKLKLPPVVAASNTIYVLDNAYYFDRLQLTSEEKARHRANLEQFKCYFTPPLNPHIPAPKKDKQSKGVVVVHIRMGDAMRTSRAGGIRRAVLLLPKLLKKLQRQYPNYEIRVHTDDEQRLQPFVQSQRCSISMKGRRTPVEDVLSDMIHAEVLVCGDSSLSKVCCFLGNDSRELILIPDTNKHTLPDSVKTFSSFV